MLFENNKYKYEGFPVSPKIVVEIIFYLYQNNSIVMSRQDISSEVFKFHLENYGANGDSNKIHQVKKALADINTSFYKNLRTGYYEFLINDETNFDDFYSPVKKTRNASKNQIKNINNSLDILNIKDGWVYFYYFPAYKELASYKNEKTFPIKIGKSKAEPKSRVGEQSGTALPEKPYIFLEVKTVDCSSLEQNIHSLLKLKGVKSTVAIGNEWFITNEENILLILQKIQELGVDLNINLKTSVLNNINE